MSSQSTAHKPATISLVSRLGQDAKSLVPCDLVTPSALLDLFTDLTAQLVDRLAELSDWGWSGGRSDQYRHDVIADELFVPQLTAAGLRVLTEESGITGTGSITVVVDPVDGSTNASQGLPWYATSLCAVDEHGPFVSLVSNLASGQTFRAVRGEGADVDSGELVPSQRTTLAESIVAFSGLPPEHGGWNQYRAYGAGALDLCSVANGRFDAYVDVNSAHGVWDYLGAYLVCQESGVPMVDAFGRDLLILDPAARRAPIAAATPELLEAVVAMRRGWSPNPEIKLSSEA